MTDSSAGSSGSDRLLESLWQDARREAEQNLNRAKAEAARLIEETRSFRQQELAGARERARDSAVPEIARILNKARASAEKMILEGRYGFLSGTLETVGALLNGSRTASEEAREAFENLFGHAAAHFERGEAVRVTVHPLDRQKAMALVSGMGLKATVTEDADVLGGARIETEDGSRLVDNTIVERLANMGESPPREVLELMLPESGQ